MFRDHSISILLQSGKANVYHAALLRYATNRIYASGTRYAGLTTVRTDVYFEFKRLIFTSVITKTIHIFKLYVTLHPHWGDILYVAIKDGAIVFLEKNSSHISPLPSLYTK